MRTLIVVARECPDIWEALRKQFAADDAVEVILDRWEKERRRVTQEWETERRRNADRRCAPTIQNDVRSRQYVIVRSKANIQLATRLALGGEKGTHPSLLKCAEVTEADGSVDGTDAMILDLVLASLVLILWET